MTATKLIKKLGFKSLIEVNDYINDPAQHMSKDQFDYMYEQYPLRFNLLIAGAMQMKVMIILGMVE